jgi:hypothetical protein
LSGPSQADISFQRDIKTAKAAAAEQQRREAEWFAYHDAETAKIAAATEAKKQRNFRGRDDVQYNFWHKPVGSLA